MKRILFTLSLISCFTTACILSSCGGSNDSLTPTDSSAINLTRIDLLLSPGISQHDVETLLEDTLFQRGIAGYAMMTGYSGESLSSFTDNYAHSASVEAFYPLVKENLSDAMQFVSVYGQALQAAKNRESDIAFPDTIYMVISPYRQKVFMVDNYLYVATNHFLGSDSEAYEGFSDDDRALRTAALMPYAALQGVIRITYPAPAAGSVNLLSAMIYEGCVSYTLQQLLPKAPASSTACLAGRQWEILSDNKNKIWNALIENNLLFSSDAELISRLTETRNPMVTGAMNLPFGTASYIGYEMVAELDRKGKLPDISKRFSPDFYTDGNLLSFAIGTFAN